MWHVLLSKTIAGLKLSSTKLLVRNWNLKKVLNEEATQVSGPSIAHTRSTGLFTKPVQRPPAVSAVCRSCQCCPSTSAADAGGAERLFG